MPISGSVALGTAAAPSALSQAPYSIYTVTNATGIYLAGFTLSNTTNIPVSVTIYQDNLTNVIYSGTLAAYQGTALAATPALQAPVQATIGANLQNGETILALANQGGVVNIEIDGSQNTLDTQSMYLLGLMLMFNKEWGTELPSQSELNASALSLTP